MRRSDLAGRVTLVTGGGGGIGAAVAEELGRLGSAVVVLDAGVALDGQSPGEPTAAATAARIVAAGGRAVAETTSVTDAAGVQDAVARTVRDLGGLDQVVEAAGIVRGGTLADATVDDWAATFGVHLGGHIAVATAAVPVMAAAGHGRLLHVTSGAGLARVAAESPVYGCAKRAVAGLTWRLAAAAPPGVTVNALSPIAATRMVAAPRAPAGGYQLDFGAMPAPAALAPVVAALCGPDAGWLHGRIVFTNGSELTLVDGPRLVEAIDGSAFGAPADLDAALVRTVVAAHAVQRTTGGAMPRLTGIEPAPPVRARVLVAAGDADLALTLRAASFDIVEAPMAAADSAALAGVDALVVRSVAGSVASGGEPWERVLEEHRRVTATVLEHAAWARAAAAHPRVRVVHLVDAATGGGDTAAQAVAQLARAVPGIASSVAVGADAPPPVVAALAAVLAAGAAGAELSGAELQVAGQWIGLRAHPEATVTFTFDGPAPPSTLLNALREAVLPSTGA
ncbi:MAG TPA: SDR family NAD(P)-dependent oxidoreductase [Solirubrobacteraceae bacterium]